MHPLKRARSKAEEKAIERVRRFCLSLPEATEKLAWGEPTFRAGKIFAMMDTHHHGADHVAVVMPAGFGVQEMLVKADPERYYVPPYVGVHGWVGARIDEKPDWGAVESLLRDAYDMITAAAGAGRAAAGRAARKARSRKRAK